MVDCYHFLCVMREETETDEKLENLADRSVHHGVYMPESRRKVPGRMAGTAGMG